MSLNLVYTCLLSHPAPPQHLSTLELGEPLPSQPQETLPRRELAHFVRGPMPP